MNEALPQTPLGFFKVRIVRSSAAPAVQGRCSRITHSLRNAPSTAYGLFKGKFACCAYGTQI